MSVYSDPAVRAAIAQETRTPWLAELGYSSLAEYMAANPVELDLDTDEADPFADADL